MFLRISLCIVLLVIVLGTSIYISQENKYGGMQETGLNHNTGNDWQGKIIPDNLHCFSPDSRLKHLQQFVEHVCVHCPAKDWQPQ